ncbi:MAG: hypothetical protein WCJ30_28045, partial [Deltaproteobacteria bacterium]
MTETDNDPRRTRIMVLRGLALGALLGSVMGAWTVSTQRGTPGIVVNTPRPAAIERCPEGYTRGAQFDPSAVMDGTSVRWLVRCDPSVSNAPVSESLEIFWSNRLYLDPRSRGPALADFVRTVAQGSHLLLEPPRDVTGVTVRGVPAAVIDADGALRLPPMAARVWVLPAGGSTVEVTAFAPREQMAGVAEAARGAMRSIRGLSPFSDAQGTTRGWTVEATCPDGYSDATPPAGGLARGIFVGRYCLAPDAQGGAEVVIAQIPGPARDEAGVRHVFDLAAESTRAAGVSTGAGFGPTEHERVHDLDAATAIMEIDTPAARIHVRAYLVPAGDATVYALATTMFDHADTARGTLERWLGEAAPVRAYDPAV